MPWRSEDAASRASREQANDSQFQVGLGGEKHSSRVMCHIAIKIDGWQAGARTILYIAAAAFQTTHPDVPQ